ncbi:MAG: cation diffusion facilitator family transporter [Bryobacterales bacterium]|nr:cation diffusion facilitator family transporter [Bryobacterales bacterium]
MEESSKKAIYGALYANIAIATTKFIVAAVTGSSAMWSEGIHSSVDTGNEILMLIGLRRSVRPPDPEHPFGHGKELYFWSLLVAVLIFGVGGGLSAYEGVLHILHPVTIREPKWNYIVLGSAFLFEGTSLFIALRVFISKHGRGNLLSNIVASKDPTTYTIIAEDSASLAGIAIAGAGVSLSYLLKLPALDGAASVLIGLLLAAVATFLIRECRGLLTGEGVDRRTAEEIRRLVREDPLVESVTWPLTMYLGPDNVLLVLDVEFRDTASAVEVADAIRNMKARIQARFPEIKRIYVEAVEHSIQSHATR